MLFVGKLLKCCRDRLCLYSVPEDFGVVPAIVARHIRAGFFAVLVLLRAVEGNNAAVALGNGQQIVLRAEPKILCDRVEALRIDFSDRMIGGKLPLFPSAKISNLTAGAPALVSGSQTVTVLGISCVSGQKPFSADGAFPRRVSDA